MKKIYFFIFLFSCVTCSKILGQSAGDYVATASMEWNTGTWSISNGSGGYTSTTTTPPTSAKNVFILSGATVTVTTSAAVCNSLTVNSGGVLTPTAAMTISGTTLITGTVILGAGSFTTNGATTVVDGTMNMTGTGACNVNSILTVNGTWNMAAGSGSLTTTKDVNISSTGILKGNTVAGANVQSIFLNGSSPTITINGQFGGPSKGVAGESIRIYPGASGTTTFTGTGTVFLARFQANSIGTVIQSIIIDIDMNFNNSNSTASPSFTLQNANLSGSSTAAKSVTINAGKTVTLSNANCGFHNTYSATSTSVTLNYGDMIYNINGTLNLSAAPFVLYSSTSTISPSPTSKLIINVGSTGVLKLGANVRMGKAQAGQIVNIKVQSGGLIDGSGAALNLTTSPISANGTNSTDKVWFTLNQGAAYKRLAPSGVATPLWIGPDTTSYNPVTITPTTTTVITAGVVSGNTPAGLSSTSEAINRTWSITPATASSSTLTMGYNGTATGGGNANASCDPTAAMGLWYYNGTSWSLIPGSSSTPAAGTMNDETVTFTGVTSFPTFALVNALSANANLSSIGLSNGTLSPVFASGTNSYTASVSNAITNITVTPTVNQANATVAVNGITVASGSASGSIALAVGANTITTVVTAQDGTTTNTYTVTVTRAASNDATLSGLTLSTGTLSPVFASGTIGYTASVSNATTAITLTPTVNQANATVKVNGTIVTSGSASGSIPLAVGTNTITTVATAQDGTTTNTYTVTVTRAASSTSLSNLVLSAGTLSPAFASATTSYAVGISLGVASITVTPTLSDPTATVTVNGTTVTSGTASNSITMNTGANTVTVVVTAPDGTTTNTYTVTVTKSSLSSISTLNNLVLSAGTLSPTFASGTIGYTASVNNATTSISVTPTVTDATASVTVNGTAVSSGSASDSIALAVGANAITTVVTAQNGVNVSTYTTTVTRAASSDATLSGLAISAGTLSPTFASGTPSYTASVSNATSSITVTPTVHESNANVTVNGTTVASGSASDSIALAVGANTITTVVTAQDGATTSIYTIIVTRAVSNDATLSGLALSTGTLSPVFASGTIGYTASVSNATTSLTVTPTVNQANATVKVNGTAVTSGSASGSIALAVGSNTITTVVTAQDGTTRGTYTVIVTRVDPTNNNLSNLTISSGTLSPTFASATNKYTATVSGTTSSVAVTPTTADPTATVTVNGTTVTSGVLDSIPLSVGSNTISIVVTAQNSATKMYTLTVTRQSIPQTITFNVLTPATYGAVDFAPGATSTNTGIAITYTSSNTAVATITSDRLIHIVGAGSTNITASQSGDGTYTAATPIIHALTVNKAGLTITADNQSKSYGATNPVLTTSYSGFVNGDTTTSLSTQPTIKTTALTGSSAGTYPITASGAASNNYSINYTAGTLTVSKVTLTIAAKDATKVYHATNPALGVTYTGFVNGDTNTKLTTQPIVSTTAVTGSAVGTYPITAGGATSNNYTISYTAGTLTVAPAPLTIAAKNTNKVYGAVNPTLALTYTGFVNGDTNTSLTTQPTISTTAVTGSAAGAYPITVLGAASPNYTIKYTEGTLTVAPATLTIAAKNATRLYGAVNPVFVVTYTGFVNGDTNTSLTTQPTISTTAVTGSAVGTYPITASGAASPNYTIRYTAGTLTVTASLDANLAGLTISTGTFSPAFAQGTTSYTASVVNAVTSLTLTPTTDDISATVKVNGVSVASGSPSPIIPLVGGTNLISTVVTAQNGKTSKTYTIKVTRARSNKAGLINLDISNGTLSPAFTPSTYFYNTFVDNTVSQFTVTPTLADSTATILVNGQPAANAAQSRLIDLRVGDNYIIVISTAEDGITKLTYAITIHRPRAPSAIQPNNILSPNADGRNDVWVVKDIEAYPNNKVTVYDKAGRVVYTKNTYNNDWNGTFRGAILAEGTYYYVIDLGTGDDRIRGFITIIRQR